MTEYGKAKRWYLTHETATYKTVAEKYGLSERTLRDMGCKEKWREQRKEYRQKHDKKATEKILEKAADKEADTYAAFYDVGLQALQKAGAALTLVPPEDCDNLRKVVSSLKDLKDILMLEKPQETVTARIELCDELEELLE